MSEVPAHVKASRVTDGQRRPNLEAEFTLLDWSRSHKATIQMRYSDTDAMGHLNNAVYVQYLETSRILLMRDLAVPDEGGRSVVARLELDYRREIKLGQVVVVESLIERLGNSSWTVISRIMADGVPSAFARTVEVGVDEHLRPAPLTEATREALGAILAQPELQETHEQSEF